jgi:hypothetical protein
MAAFGSVILADELFQDVTLQQQLDAPARKERMWVRSGCDMVCCHCCIAIEKSHFVSMHNTAAGGL